MTDMLLEDIGQFRDMLGVWLYRAMKSETGVTEEEVLAYANRFSRDGCRTPMQWANAPNGGFSPAAIKAWLLVNKNYAQGVNVADQQNDPDSLLNYYRRMLRMRRQTPALISGDYTPLDEDAEDYLAFLRHSQDDKQTCLVVLNMSKRPQRLHFNLENQRSKVLFSSHKRKNTSDDLTRLSIAPFEVYIAELKSV